MDVYILINCFSYVIKCQITNGVDYWKRYNIYSLTLEVLPPEKVIYST